MKLNRARNDATWTHWPLQTSPVQPEAFDCFWDRTIPFRGSHPKRKRPQGLAGGSGRLADCKLNRWGRVWGEWCRKWRIGRKGSRTGSLWLVRVDLWVVWLQLSDSRLRNLNSFWKPLTELNLKGCLLFV